MSEKLKPCPFCGSNNIQLHLDKYVPDMVASGVSYIECRDCYASTGRVCGGKLKARKEKVIKHWNGRVESQEALNETT